MHKQDEPPQHYSLFELNQHLRRIISFNLRECIWIKGELAEVKFNRGNMYLSMVERDDFRLRAKSQCIIFFKDLEKIRKNVGAALESILQVGRQILVKVQVVFSELHGMSLQIKAVDPTFTIGQLELQRLATLKKLEAEKFIPLNHQLPLKAVPQNIAIVSSKSAAGLHDFLDQLHHNAQGYTFNTKLFPTAVQGVNMAIELVEQINSIEQQKDSFDAIVIVRGGGARLDLTGFDQFEVCKTIALCELPIITGIGHETDETLTDLVAHTALKTPTAVADFLLQRIQQFENQIQNTVLEIQRLVQQRLYNEYAKLDQLQYYLKYHLDNRFYQEQQKLELLHQKLELLLPEKNLKRGFVMLFRQNGQAIRSIEDIQKGESLFLQLADGKVKIKIEDLLH